MALVLADDGVAGGCDRYQVRDRFGVVAALACSEGPRGAEPPSSVEPQPIVNGAPADEAKYAAVGALAWFLEGYGGVHVFCSGTLVAPQAIVTARHCTPSIEDAAAIGVVPVFAFGPDGYNPTAFVPITSYVNAPPSPQPDGGLLLDGGRDVAVAQLESAVTDVIPAKLGAFDDGMVGQQFLIAGYGYNEPASPGRSSKAS